MTKQHYQLTAASDLTALELLKQTGLNVATLKQAASDGAVWLEASAKPKRIRRLKQPIKTGNRIHLYFDPDIIGAQITNASCIHDGHEFSIWCKPRGMFSQGSKWGDANSISRYVEVTSGRPTYLVHRLDRMTSGLIVLSHKKSLVRYFTNQFEQRTIGKTYHAVVHGNFSSENITLDSSLDGKAAVSIINKLAYKAKVDRSLVEVQIKTGRKHQIRCHLADFGYPIIGDRLYGNEQSEFSLQLVAVELSLEYPTDHKRHTIRLNESEIRVWLNAWDSPS